ncbi:hypothetical protein Tco_0586368 [Tanacetum coccineum]
MGEENPIRTLGDYSKPSPEGYRNTIELPEGNNMVPLRSDTIRLETNDAHPTDLSSENPNQTYLKDFLKLVDSLDVDGENRERTRLGPHDTQSCMENPEQAFVEYASSRTDEAGEGLVSEFMASQDARLSKFEANFKQQPSEMTNKIDIVLKAITERIAGTLPSDTIKNLKLGTHPDDGEVMFIEIIRDDEPQNKDPNEGEEEMTEEPVVEYFDTFPTRNELTYYSLSLDEEDKRKKSKEDVMSKILWNLQRMPKGLDSKNLTGGDDKGESHKDMLYLNEENLGKFLESFIGYSLNELI